MTPPVVWVDGAHVDGAVPHLSALDRGFSLGDGVFDTLRAVGGEPIDADLHMDRLLLWAEALGIAPLPSTASLVEVVADVAQQVGAPFASVRTTMTRGPASARGLAPAPPIRPTTVVQGEAFDPRLVSTPVRLTVAAVQRNPSSPAARMKTCSALDQVIALTAARRDGYDDALLCTPDGRIACTSAANVFVVIDGAILTPSLDAGVVPGITRRRLIERATGHGLVVHQRNILLADARGASEMFLTNSLIGARPVSALDTWPLRDVDGPLTRLMREALAWPAVLDPSADSHT